MNENPPFTCEFPDASEDNPLVTISIPTFNSEPFLGLCLDAVKKQTYPNIEVNIVDGNSTDKTVPIAKEHGVRNIREYPGALLGARYEGVKTAKGDYTLLLDSDQVLEIDAIERAVKMAIGKQLDMLVLEEDVYKQDTFLEKLFHYDRLLIHAVKDFDPMTSVMLPRFYRTEQLRKAMESIPEEIREKVSGQDHAIIYYEMWKMTQKVDLLPLAVRHIEPNSLRVMWKKFYRWGATSVNAKFGPYEKFLAEKEGFRKGMWTKGLITASIASVVLLLIKGVPYKLGQVRKRNESKD